MGKQPPGETRYLLDHAYFTLWSMLGGGVATSSFNQLQLEQVPVAKGSCSCYCWLARESVSVLRDRATPPGPSRGGRTLSLWDALHLKPCSAKIFLAKEEDKRTNGKEREIMKEPL